MRKIIAALTAAVLSLPVAASASAAAISTAEAPPSVRSEAYVLMDAQSGQILASKNPDQQEYPASITKVMTVALALREHKATDKLTVSQEVVDTVPRDSTHIALTDGERVSVGDMVNVTMVESANDAAAALAEYTGGSIAAFVDMMNRQAAGLGAVNTRFSNPTGLHDPQHYTTARDFAHIMRWALTVPGFREVLSATEYTMDPTNKQKEKRYVETHDSMIVESAYTYDGAEGGKLGWTPEAKHTYAAAAKRGDMELVFVSLKTDGKWDKFEDAVSIFNYGFDRFERLNYPNRLDYDPYIQVYDGETQIGKLRFQLPQSWPVDLPKGGSLEDVSVSLDAPSRYEVDELDAAAPKFIFTYRGEELYAYPIPFVRFGQDMPEGEAQPVEGAINIRMSPVIIWWIVGVLALAAVIILILQLIAASRRRKRRIRDSRRRLGRP